jgi:flagellar biosynthesis protein FliR
METLHLEPMVLAALVIGVRVSGLILFAPFLSSQAIPAQLKVALTIALSALIYPVYHLPPIAAGIAGWMGVIAAELAIGSLLGLAMQVVMEGAQMAGQIVGIQAGYSLVTLFDPQTQADTAVMSTFNQLLVLLIFLQLDVHHWLLRGLVASFDYLPPGSVISGTKAAIGLLQAAGGIWLAGLEIAAPVVMATMLVDVTLGFLAKASPQLPVLFLGLPVKNLLSLAILAASVVLWPRVFEQRFYSAIALGERLLNLAK